MTIVPADSRTGSLWPACPDQRPRRISSRPLMNTEAPLIKSSRPGRRYHFGTIVGQSRRIEEVFQRIDRVARTDSTVLSHRRIRHGQGVDRPGDPLRINPPGKTVGSRSIAGPYPRKLLESELFGHETRGPLPAPSEPGSGVLRWLKGGLSF